MTSINAPRAQAERAQLQFALAPLLRTVARWAGVPVDAAPDGHPGLGADLYQGTPAATKTSGPSPVDTAPAAAGAANQGEAYSGMPSPQRAGTTGSRVLSTDATAHTPETNPHQSAPVAPRPYETAAAAATVARGPLETAPERATDPSRFAPLPRHAPAGPGPFAKAAPASAPAMVHLARLRTVSPANAPEPTARTFRHGATTVPAMPASNIPAQPDGQRPAWTTARSAVATMAEADPWRDVAALSMAQASPGSPATAPRSEPRLQTGFAESTRLAAPPTAPVGNSAAGFDPFETSRLEEAMSDALRRAAQEAGIDLS